MTFFFQQWEGSQGIFLPRRSTKADSKEKQQGLLTPRSTKVAKAWTRHRRISVTGNLFISKLLIKKSHCKMCYCTYLVFIVPLLEKQNYLLYYFVFYIYYMKTVIKHTGKTFFISSSHKRLDREDILYYFLSFCFIKLIITHGENCGTTYVNS